MVTTIANAAAIIVPAEIDALFIQPLLAASIASQVATVVSTSTKDFRIPRVATDPTAAWVAEGQEISPSDITLDEVLVTPLKVAGLTIITRELADDSNPAAAAVVGDGLARDVARKVDSAFFGNLAAPAPKGLASLTATGPTGATTVSAGTAWTNADPFSAAVFEASNRNATISAWVANPTDGLALAQLKQSSTTNVPLLTPDATAPSRSVIQGIPMFTTPAVAAGTIYGIPADRAVMVVRDDPTVEADRSVFFTSDRVAVRVTARIGFAFPQPAAIVKIVKS